MSETLKRKVEIGKGGSKRTKATQLRVPKRSLNVQAEDTEIADKRMRADDYEDSMWDREINRVSGTQ